MNVIGKSTVKIDLLGDLDRRDATARARCRARTSRRRTAAAGRRRRAGCRDPGVDRPADDEAATASARSGCRRCRRRPTAIRPISTAERAIGSERNRSMMPLPMSSAMPIAVVAGGEHDRLGEDPGHQELAVDSVRRIAGQRDRAAEDEREQQHEHDRLEDREDRELRDPRDPLQVAPADDRAPSLTAGRRRRRRRAAGWSRCAVMRPSCRGRLVRRRLLDRDVAGQAEEHVVERRRRRPMSSIAMPASSKSRMTVTRRLAPPSGGHRQPARVLVDGRRRRSPIALRGSAAHRDPGRGRGRRPRCARHRPGP